MSPGHGGRSVSLDDDPLSSSSSSVSFQPAAPTAPPLPPHPLHQPRPVSTSNKLLEEELRTLDIGVDWRKRNDIEYEKIHE